jgi:single-strand DNA-binding protein
MNQLKNRVQLIGRLGQDPEVKNFPDGKMVVRFSLATTETYKNAEGEKVNDTQWHQVVAWGSLGGIVATWLSKGKEVMVEGKVCYRQYENKEGRKVYYTEIVARDLLMLNKGGQEQLRVSSGVPAGA